MGLSKRYRACTSVSIFRWICLRNLEWSRPASRSKSLLWSRTCRILSRERRGSRPNMAKRYWRLCEQNPPGIFESVSTQTLSGSVQRWRTATHQWKDTITKPQIPGHQHHYKFLYLGVRIGILANFQMEPEGYPYEVVVVDRWDGDIYKTVT